MSDFGNPSVIATWTAHGKSWRLVATGFRGTGKTTHVLEVAESDTMGATAWRSHVRIDATKPDLYTLALGMESMQRL